MFAFMRLLLLAIALTACARASSAPAPAASTSYPDSYETIIAGGKIVDGTGNAWFYGDIGLSGGRIARITPAGMLARTQAARRIDARGLVVAPGAIDIQAHSEEQLLYGDSRVISMITQGVTTAIMGEGETPGQISATMFADYLKSGDSLALDVGLDGNRLLVARVKTYLDSEKEPVDLQVNFSTLPDTATFAANIVLACPGKKLKVIVDSTGYRKMSQ